MIAVLLVWSPAFAEEKPDSPDKNARPNGEATEAQQSLRAYLQVQEQLHSALLAIEQARKDAEAAAQRNNEAIQQARQESDAAAQRNAEMIRARLTIIEQTLTNQREREMQVMQKSNHLMLTIGALVGGLGFLGMVFTAFCLWRALTRVAQITSTLQPFHAVGHHAAPGLTNSDGPFVTLNGPEMSGTRLLGAIEQLEKRIQDLEHTALLPHKLDAPAHIDVQENGELDEPVSKADRIASLIDKGQALLNSSEPEKALGWFDEALKLDPRNAEALVKRGAALEQLKRLEEAIDCYDRAIATNQTLTVAYLHKGAVYNQLERFSEALECYEQALRTQQKPVNS